MASRPLRPGDPAPSVTLPAVNREGQVSLDDYRGHSPVLIALFRGLHCPFCRRQLVQLGTTQEKLKEVGVETMAVVNTPLERARLYFKTALRLERGGRTEDALLLYTLAFDQAGRNRDAAIYKNLGLLHNKSNDVAKARACLRGYLDKNPDALDAERVRATLASFPPTKTIPCVDGGEIARARRMAERRGATIDAWLNETIEDRLR